MTLPSRPLPLFARIATLTCHHNIRVSLRAFSGSSRNLKFLPKFPDSTSPELLDVLTTIRSRILLPAMLNNQQYKLMTDRTRKDYLDKEDVRVSIGDTDVRLTHLDPQKDFANRAETFDDALRLTVESTPDPSTAPLEGESDTVPEDANESTGDWEVWHSLLRGYSSARITLNNRQQSAFVRSALAAGQLGLVMRCLRSVNSTKLSLNRAALRHPIMISLRDRAERNQWSTAATETAWKQTVELNQLMDHTEHAGRTGKRIGKRDPRAEALMIAVPLEIAVQGVSNNDEKKAVWEERARVMAVRLVAALEQQTTDLEIDELWTIRELRDSEAEISNNRKRGFKAAEYARVEDLVHTWTAVAHALRIAEKHFAATEHTQFVQRLGDTVKLIEERLPQAKAILASKEPGRDTESES